MKVEKAPTSLPKTDAPDGARANRPANGQTLDDGARQTTAPTIAADGSQQAGLEKDINMSSTRPGIADIASQDTSLAANTHALLDDILACFAFFTRVPVPARIHAHPPHPGMTWALPIVGVFLALIAGLVLLLTAFLGLSPVLSALVVLSVGLLMTGAFHEDGLADIADGFGGGATAERKLSIMKDSRLGTYGSAALILSLMFRVVAISELLDAKGALLASLTLIPVYAASRSAALWILVGLPAARDKGAAAAVGKPAKRAFTVSLCISAALVGALLTPVHGLLATLACLLVPAFVVYGLGRVSLAQINGQTGDVAGAAQQLSEIALLLTILIFSKAGT